MCENPGVLPSPKQMLLRVTLLVCVLLVGLVVGGTLGQVVLWAGGALALFWLLREVVPTLRRRGRP
ncbi:MAG: hypothetical protein QOF77_550 [Solirubrobacteraceae bacterium]|jgi:hypothetical protein|nr:hypothetical protein [Solirubrobacteraceae bacterium]